ncbi:hypothetical protein JMJ35_004149 [Cladonia borealis]|uniref:Uncharacterized protein n=1 Tax=Cladonia borealis TaxID=184061 RepID=A0AA39V281_9LECA|nr:hypothetical protein JMJ35_004149 [Cladonia borealis]
MRLHSVSSLLTALLFVVGSSTSPLAYPNGKLEQINALRARGVSEAAIAARFPRPAKVSIVAPLASPSPDPVIHSTDLLDAQVIFSDQYADMPPKKRRLTHSVGQRGTEMGRQL